MIEIEKKNVEEAEKAIMEEYQASKGKTIDDPFTRRSTKPRMGFSSKNDVVDAAAAAAVVDVVAAEVADAVDAVDAVDAAAVEMMPWPY